MLPLLAAGASLLGSIIGGNTAADAANRQREALRQAQARAEGQINQGIDAYNPYANAGLTALQGYQNLMSGQGSSNFASNPAFAYQSQLLNQKMAKSRQSVSPSAMSVYSTPLISQEYTNTLNRLSPLMNMGFSATTSLLNISCYMIEDLH